jgi:hypothetical protein
MGIFSGMVDTVKGMMGLKTVDSEPLKYGESFRTKEDVIEFSKKEFERRQKERRPKELQWVLNQNFLNGNQFCDINIYMQEVQQIEKEYEWEEREVFNQLAPIYETRLAKLKKNRPVPFAVPATLESSHLNTAKTSTTVLKAIDKDQNMSDKRALASAWTEICGCCFFKHTWDPKAGRLVGELDGEKIYEGGEVKDIVSPFEIFPDSNFSNGIEGCRSLIHARAYHKDEIEERWPVDVDGKPVTITGRKLDVFTLSQTNIGTGGLGYTATVYNFVSTAIEDHEIVIEHAILPCRKFPNGLIIISAADKLLHYGAYPYRVGDDMRPGLNFSMQICIETPGYFWPATVLERLIPIQRSYNAVKNKKHEVLNRIAIGNLAIEDDGNVNVEELQQEGLYPGKIHLYPRGGTPPKAIEIKGSTSEFSEEEAKLEEQFAMISGVSPFSSQSLPPTGIISGDALERLKESDDSRISLTADNINSAAIRGWKIDIRLNRQFAKGPRLSRYVGENNEVELIDWYASDLTSDDIIIEKEDELSETPAQKKQLGVMLLQYGLYDETKVSPKVRNKFLRDYKLGTPEAVDDIEEMHVNKAKRENRMLQQGMPVQADDFDIDELHIVEHDRFRLDIQYEQLKQTNPQAVMAFTQHCQQHNQRIQQKQAAMMQAQNPQKGPAMSIPYKDAPPVAQVQMLEQAGIQVNPEDIVQKIQIDQAAKQKQESTKQAS